MLGEDSRDPFAGVAVAVRITAIRHDFPEFLIEYRFVHGALNRLEFRFDKDHVLGVLTTALPRPDINGRQTKQRSFNNSCARVSHQNTSPAEKVDKYGPREITVKVKHPRILACVFFHYVYDFLGVPGWIWV